MYSSIYRRFTSILSEMVKIKKKNLTINTYFEKDLGLDKDGLKELRRKIDDEFSIKLPKNIFKDFNTVGELIGFIEAEIMR
ncbi:MAG: acyl carrier protein [Candidatus Heimdallarchaeaceae archaeon]